MNTILANMYGTSGHSETDLEKNSSDEAILDEIVKIAEESGVSMDDLSDDEVIELMAAARSYLDGADEPEYEDEVKVAYEDGPSDDELQKMAAHGDFIGRVMAHALTQELNKIAAEQDAGEGEVSEEVMYRAQEILEAAQSRVGAGTSKTASARAAVEAALEKKAAEANLDAAALSVLEANGYDVSEILEILA